MEKKPVTLKNVTLYWPFLRVTNGLSGKYQVDICNLSESQVDGLKRLGLNIRNKGDDRGDFFTAKSAKYAIIPVDEEGNEIPEDVVVGNGTKADVRGSIYQWTHAPTKKSGYSFSINIKGLIVKDLVSYNANNDDTDFGDLEEEVL